MWIGVPVEEILLKVCHVHILYTITAPNAHVLRRIEPAMLTVDVN